MDAADARAILKEGMVLGLSASTLADAQAAERAGADYIGVGTVFPTSTKMGKPLIGPAGAARLAASVAIPAFPIGGIDATGATELAREGCGRAAVCAGILAGTDVRERTAAIALALRGET
jgi:thiamine-phosphate pyrophosphorylase